MPQSHKTSSRYSIAKESDVADACLQFRQLAGTIPLSQSQEDFIQWSWHLDGAEMSSEAYVYLLYESGGGAGCNRALDIRHSRAAGIYRCATLLPYYMSVIFHEWFN
jgi:hypothetical protein